MERFYIYGFVSVRFLYPR